MPFALWDGERHTLLCGRDPFGKKPFYYYHQNSQFIFASEIEAVVAALDRRPDIDHYMVAYYLFKGYFAPGRSIYETIRTLQAGHYLKINNRTDEFREEPY